MTLAQFMFNWGLGFFVFALLIMIGVFLFHVAEETDILFAKISAYLYAVSIALLFGIVLLFLSCATWIVISGEQNVPAQVLEFFSGPLKGQQ